MLVNVTGSMDIGLEEVETAANLVQQAAHPDALIIFGAAFDDELEDEIRVTVIATGFEENVGAGMNANPCTKAGERAAAAGAAAAPSGKRPSLEPLPDKEPDQEDDPFVDIFKIFNKDR